MPQLGLLEFVSKLWQVVASCGELWASCGKHESTGNIARKYIVRMFEFAMIVPILGLRPCNERI